MMNHFVVLIIVMVIAFVLHRLLVEPFVAGSEIEDDIVNGNPVSWSGKPNRREADPVNGPRHPVVYQGTPGPLAYEERPTAPVTKSMVYFDQSDCRPECCLYSPYSCGHGCVCWRKPTDREPPVTQMSKITPRS
jgi:hypothetical protein